MLEYLQHAGIKTQHMTDEQAIKGEYLRQIYRLDARSRLVNSEGKVIAKARNPRHLVAR